MTAIAVVFALACLLPGCSARQVEKTPNGGIVAIPSNDNYWPFKYRDKAEELMAEHLGPGGYEIVKEEEIKVGELKHVDQRREEQEAEVIDDFLTVGTTRTATTERTSDMTEYRIHYRRRGSSDNTDMAGFGGSSPY